MVMNLISKHTFSSLLSARRPAQGERPIRDESGFTLIELLVVIVLLGITTAMFSTTFGTVLSRNSVVQSQNIMQTEVRYAVNQLVSDLRNANPANSYFPIISADANSISFYTPDRLSDNRMLRIKYWLDGTTLKRQVTKSTGFDTTTSKWTGIDSDTGPIQTVVASVRAPSVGDTSQGGWSNGRIFKYCKKAPPDMKVDASNSTSAEPITWNCDFVTTVTQIKTVVVRIVVSANSSSSQYNYGAVATVRWNAE